MEAGSLLQLFKNLDDNISQVEFHPDGCILGCSSKGGSIDIWDIREGVCKAKLSLESPATGLSFSQNGYHLASAEQSGVVQLWDLRKSTTFLSTTLNQPAVSVTFDESGTYLAATGSQGSVKLMHMESKHSLVEAGSLTLATNPCRVAWGPQAAWLLAGSESQSTVELWRPKVC